MRISVCAPSYKRTSKVLTFDYLPFVRLFVDESEAPDYQRNFPGKDIHSCPDGVQGNISRVRNYILSQTIGKGDDAVCIIDDDLGSINYWEGKGKEREVKAQDFQAFLEKYTILAQDIGSFIWGININRDPQIYRTYAPFSTVSFIGAPFGVILKGNNCLYDEALPLKEDYDMTIQQLNKNRVVLRVNKYFYKAKQSEQEGGCAAYRSLDREKEQFDLLQKKWGSKIVQQDRNNRSHNLKKSKQNHFDYNPVIRIPIQGV